MALFKKTVPTRTAWFVLLLIVDALLIGIGILAYVVLTLPQLPDDPELLLAQSGINIYADSGELLYSLNRQTTQMHIEQVSPHFVQAVLATEDLDFYRHHGYSIKSMVGMFYDNIRHFRKMRGGSTITQQIVKNIFLTREKSYIRKLKEIFLATQLETLFQRHYGPKYKDRILELYINGNFYGTNAYGIADAARTYFGKSAADLNLLESALLAGLPNAPSAFNPFRQNKTSMMNRVAHVLTRMEMAGFITAKEYQQTLSTDLQFTTQRTPQNRTPYFVETIKTEIARIWGPSALSFGGLNIYTTLDLHMQQAAERAVVERLTELDTQLGFAPYTTVPPEKRANYVQGALICLDPRNGHVKAMVGGRDIFISYYNRATQAQRQPGSGFKPILYLAAFETGLVTPVSLFIDEPRTYEINNRPWSPKNFKDNYLGLTTAANALVNSANATSVQIAYLIDPKRVVNLAQRLGVQSSLHPYPSIALGSEEVTLLDMATAYGTIASYGFRVDPTFITRIEDSEGTPVYTHSPNPIPVLEPDLAFLIIKLMQHVVDHGTGHTIRTLGFQGPVAGKTGTTNDNADAWFTGFTPHLVTSTWIGFDNRENRQTLIDIHTHQQITGGNGPAPIWANFMTTIGADTSSSTFYVPDGITEYLLDLRTGIVPRVSNSMAENAQTIALPHNIKPNTPADTLSFMKEVKREN